MSKMNRRSLEQDADFMEEIVYHVQWHGGTIDGAIDKYIAIAKEPHTMNAQQIIDRLNEISAELDDVGESIIDCVVDTRADDGLPPFTPEELAEAEAECNRNAETEVALWTENHCLQEDYFLLTGKYPRLYGDRFREPFAWED